MAKFDAKSFNPQAFKYLVDRVPNLQTNELRKSRAVKSSGGYGALMDEQNGTGYARVAMRGLLDGDAVNYDGQTDITATSTKTFEQGVVVVGRAKGWTEKDFSYDITGGVDFMANIAQQVAAYKDGLDQETIIATLKGIFAMTGGKNEEFVTKHTTDVSAEGDGKVGATTLNTAISNACGANKKKFTMVIMHSVVATNLENMNLLEFLKQTDKDGVTRDLGMATWNGRLVLIDDDMPVDESGDEPLYTTYVLGTDALTLEDVGAKVPYEMSRNPAKNGGEDTLYMRQRKALAVFGISYEKKSQASLSPTEAELENGANWALVNSGEESDANRSYINHKAIPIAKIVSKG